MPYRARFIGAIILSISAAALAPLRPILVQKAIDGPVPEGDYDGLFFFMGLIVAHIVITSAVMFLNAYLTNWLGQKVIKDMRNRVFRKIIKFRLRYFDKNQVGTLITRCISDIETISNIFSQGLIAVVADLLQLILITAYMFWMDWRLSLVALSVLPVLLIASEMFRRGIKKAFQQVREQVSRLNAFVQERITGMSVVQAFAVEEGQYEKFKVINAKHRDAHINSVFYYAVYFPVVEIITSLSIGLVIWWGTRDLESTTLTPGVIVAFIMFIGMFFRPIRMIADRFNTIQMGLVAANRVFQVLDTEDQQIDSGNRTDDIQGKIEFDKVFFSYDGENDVLKSVSFSLQEGKSLAIVGATGAGKSTIINLISRLYPHRNGKILIDGIPVEEFDKQYLRSRISVVMQDVFLFSGSIRDNIRLLNPEISDEQIVEAAKQIGAWPFIEKLDEGLEYNVRERGASLSVGQRQLISFIRALVFNPDILILDEATSSVDSETELTIQLAIEKMMRGRTSIIIAHRLSTIESADTILVLDKGEVVEHGTHQELLVKDGYYAQLHKNISTTI